MVIHVVKPGENLYMIARRYAVPLQRIIQDNQIENPSLLMVGQALVIRGDIESYTIKEGDTLYDIARRYNISLKRLLQMNPQIKNPSLIYPGTVIEVPAKKEVVDMIKVNGYVFPGSSVNVVRRTLPYLTYLSIFSYSVNTNGSLNSINDVPMIELARANKVAPLMVITNTKERGGFDSDIARAVLTDMTAQENLIENIIDILNTKKYYGLNIDFEYVYPEDKDAYNRFLQRISDRLHRLGYIVTTSLAPKYSATQKGVLYEAHDYEAHGRLADLVILMTYEWGYTYGPPLAVAPLPEVRRVVDYAVTEIPPQKILLGIPNYGYDWPLPYVQGKTRAKVVSNTGAIRLAEKYKVAIQYDETAQAPYFTYFDENKVQHIVWFEDARSINAKLNLVEEYDLGGVSYWTLSNYFSQNWLVLTDKYNVEKLF